MNSPRQSSASRNAALVRAASHRLARTRTPRMPSPGGSPFVPGGAKSNRRLPPDQRGRTIPLRRRAAAAAREGDPATARRRRVPARRARHTRLRSAGSTVRPTRTAPGPVSPSPATPRARTADNVSTTSVDGTGRPTDSASRICAHLSRAVSAASPEAPASSAIARVDACRQPKRGIIDGQHRGRLDPRNQLREVCPRRGRVLLRCAHLMQPDPLAETNCCPRTATLECSHGEPSRLERPTGLDRRH